MSHITNNKNRELMELLEKGYKEMADINLRLAEEGVASDNEALSAAEKKLEE